MQDVVLLLNIVRLLSFFFSGKALFGTRGAAGSTPVALLGCCFLLEMEMYQHSVPSSIEEHVIMNCLAHVTNCIAIIPLLPPPSLTRMVFGLQTMPDINAGNFFSCSNGVQFCLVRFNYSCNCIASISLHVTHQQVMIPALSMSVWGAAIN